MRGEEGRLIGRLSWRGIRVSERECWEGTRTAAIRGELEAFVPVWLSSGPFRSLIRTLSLIWRLCVLRTPCAITLPLTVTPGLLISPRQRERKKERYTLTQPLCPSQLNTDSVFTVEKVTLYFNEYLNEANKYTEYRVRAKEKNNIQGLFTPGHFMLLYWWDSYLIYILLICSIYTWPHICVSAKRI